METLFLVFFIFASLTLLVMVGLVGFITYNLYSRQKPRTVVLEEDDVQAKPSQAGVPLDQFTPDFKKPLTYKIVEENDQTILEEAEDQ